MAADPRKTASLVSRKCARSQTQHQRNQSSRRDLLNSVTQFGELEILNDVGFGQIGEGLRALAGVSDSVRSGESVVPGREGDNLFNSTLGTVANTSLDNVNGGGLAVLDALGIDSGTVQQVGNFYPQVANRTQGQAEAIFEKVKQGEFTLQDIPEFFSDFQNLEQLARGIFNPSSSTKSQDRLCTASPYAVDLIAYAPKYNFLFIIDVQFSEPYKEWGGDKSFGDGLAFVVKRSTRPAVEFDYEEVNMYNFWTRVPKRTIYPPVTMSFYDDNKNAAHLFYTAYMRAMSPIANMYNRFPQVGSYEVDNMNWQRPADGATFDETSPELFGYSSSLGPLLDNKTSIIQRIRLFHVFDYGRLMNVYNFFNPRILSFTPTPLNMAETGDGAEFEFEFAYDGMFIEPGYSVEAKGGFASADIGGLTSHGNTYPIIPVFALDEETYHSQQTFAPSAQEQSGFEIPTNQRLDLETQTTQPADSGNVSTGSTGASNLLQSVQDTVSNAYRSGSQFISSLFSDG